MNRFYIIIGDWFRDGHGMYEKYLYETNYPTEELEEAYQRSVELTKVNLYDVCADYMENTIDSDVVNKLLPHDFHEFLDGVEEDEGTYRMFPNNMADLVIWFLRLSMPKDFICNICENDVPRPFKSFGYGLFE